MGVEQPIFIVGVGRSGSSVFHRILSAHPRVSWLSRFCDEHPENPVWNRLLMRGLDLPVLGDYLASRVDPGEAYAFWDHYYPGFSVPCRDLVAGDVTNFTRSAVRSVLARMGPSGRDRLLIKITGWPRLGFLREIFPDARFIHILRDGRPVASSFLKVDWWWGWRGPENWRWGPLSPEYHREWLQHDRSFVALAGIQWKILMDAMVSARTQVDPSQFLEISYEDLCSAPMETMRKAVDFCRLDWSPRLEAMVKRTPLRSENDKWRKDFTGDQQAILDTVLQDHLRRYGYA